MDDSLSSWVLFLFVLIANTNESLDGILVTIAVVGGGGDKRVSCGKKTSETFYIMLSIIAMYCEPSTMDNHYLFAHLYSLLDWASGGRIYFLCILVSEMSSTVLGM